ncbi:N-acetylmuramoyl-L-alanine amidase [Nonomuraea sp. K274]|uniref:N-acetylmuramoyl-L-alanine amidase n=1 Tax=Nonomuraea cypriaca TaxID=1187855 RepID=A0A931AKD8_9ACTN|nr:peptidoglycan recognition family protein [Nonomuraea cypriaca]MBF8191785.1 N-acetylmuramoyl-L-alanine amidase [Nonomuraea cypriaca]
MQWKRLRGAALSVLLAASGLLAAGIPALASAPDGTMAAAFTKATAEYQVPRDLLVAIGYGETRLDDHDGEPSADNGYGVMHLVSNPKRKTLEQAAELTGEPVAKLKSDTAANILGGAAVLRAFADEVGLSAAQRGRADAWYPVVARYGGAANDQVARLYADTVYDLLAGGLTATGEEKIRVSPRAVKPERGRYERVTPLGRSTGDAKAADVGVQSADYPPAHWVAAAPGNYQAGRSKPIRYIVVHVTQGSYAGSISWFQNPASGVSAHYVIRSSDGDVTQMVRDGDTAYHARSANPEALGIEHEGYVDNPSWFTDAMYRSSAALTRHLADKHGIPRTRAHIVGHNELPGNDHTDPGPHWNWDYYMQLVNGGSVFGGSPADFDGDGKDDVVTFTHGANSDVYVALSNGSRFDGTSVKWHDWFAPSGETPYTGDFDGDGKDDVVAFTHGANSDVYVATSTGTSFGAGAKWQDWFAVSGEVPAVGDFDGDGKDDIVTFTRGTNADVFVALSTGTSFGTAGRWHDFFAPGVEFPAVGDVDGDGKDDLIVFTQGSTADVYVALSTGTSFAPAVKVHDWFAPAGEQPRVGDFDGDGKADIAAFTGGTGADVFVALSDGSGFGGARVWNEFFAPAGEFPYTGDYDGDGKDDIVTFTRGATNDVYVSLSSGTAFAGGGKWHDFFGMNGETTL